MSKYSQYVDIATTQIGNHLVISRNCRPASSCWGAYRKIAVLEMTTKGLIRWQLNPWQPQTKDSSYVTVKATWNNCHSGKTDRCCAAIAEDDAFEYAKMLEQRRDNTLAAQRAASRAMREPEEL